MEVLGSFLNWASDAANSNLVRTLTALLGIPGALWGLYLFIRWMRGSGLDARVEAIHAQNKTLQEDFHIWLARLDQIAIKENQRTSERVPENKGELPSENDLRTLGNAALSSLPERPRLLIGNLNIRVSDFPEQKILDHYGLESKMDLLGHFEGLALSDAAQPSNLGTENVIWLFRRPILAYWAEHEETLRAIVTYVVVRKLAEFFGLSDDDVDAL